YRRMGGALRNPIITARTVDRLSRRLPFGPARGPDPLVPPSHTPSYQYVSVLRGCCLVERSADISRQFHRVIIGPEMDKEHPGLLVEHVTVDRRYFDVAGTQRTDQRVDLVARHQEITCDRGLAAAGRLEVDGVGAAERG